jgi:preprotein translocase subunit YajC
MILAAEDDSSGGGAALVQLGILLLIPLALYFLMIRPQRRRMREQATLQSSLEVGDEVITTSGVYGFITGFDEDRVWLEIDEDVQIRLSRGAIAGKAPTSAPAPEATSKPERPDTTADKSTGDSAE